MSGWDNWAGMLIENGKNETGAIIGVGGQYIWGRTYGFTLTKYNVYVDDGTGTGFKKTVYIDEGAKLVEGKIT